MKPKLMLGLASSLVMSMAVAAPQLDQSNLGTVTAGTAIGKDDFVGQVITTGASGVLTSVDFSIRKFDGVTFGDVTLQIRDVTASGGPGATILGSKTFANASISPTTADFTTFDLRSLNLSFSSGDEFALVVTSANQSGSPFPIALTDDVYLDGGLYSSADGTNWFEFSNKDARFRTFVEDPVQLVGIDVKPGSDPNCFNINGHGVIPVAILGSASFDVADIDLSSLSFGGLSVMVRGKKGPMCNAEYSDSDAFLDLVCHFEDDPENWSAGSEQARLSGVLLGGGAFEGADSICIVP